MSTTDPFSEDYIPQNIRADVIYAKVMDLERTKEDSPYWFDCPVCKAGTIGIMRDTTTFKLKITNRCLLCGQTFIFNDLRKLFNDVE